MHSTPISTYDRGVVGEQIACDYLIKKGYLVLDRNFRYKGGEIDIIAKDQNDLVFIEVKLRNSMGYGYPEEAVTHAKKQRITKGIKAFISRKDVDSYCIRFDIIAIENINNVSTIRHNKNIELSSRVC